MRKATIKVRTDIRERHKQKIQCEISCLHKVQKIIDFKIKHYNENGAPLDLSDISCDFEGKGYV